MAPGSSARNRGRLPVPHRWVFVNRGRHHCSEDRLRYRFLSALVAVGKGHQPKHIKWERSTTGDSLAPEGNDKPFLRSEAEASRIFPLSPE